MNAVLIAADMSLDDGTWDQSAIHQEVCGLAALAFAWAFAKHPVPPTRGSGTQYSRVLG